MKGRTTVRDSLVAQKPCYPFKVNAIPLFVKMFPLTYLSLAAIFLDLSKEQNYVQSMPGHRQEAANRQ